jgi:predicted Fe-Mo cluster-binding NifX family protein
MEEVMRIAIPTVDGVLCMHFGHSEKFALVDVDGEAVKGVQFLTPPPHAPGVLPKWLHEQGANVIIASGMGSRAQMLFKENDIDVLVGAPIMEPEKIVKQYIAGELVLAGNVCDH